MNAIQLEEFLKGIAKAAQLPAELVDRDLPLAKKENLNALYACGYHYYENGKYGAALDIFRFLTRIDVTQAKFWKGLGACCQLLRSYHEALEAYSRAAFLNPTDIDLHLNAADCCFSSGQLSRGHEALKVVEELANEKDEHRHFIEKLEVLRHVWPLEDGKNGL